MPVSPDLIQLGRSLAVSCNPSESFSSLPVIEEVESMKQDAKTARSRTAALSTHGRHGVSWIRIRFR